MGCVGFAYGGHCGIRRVESEANLSSNSYSVLGDLTGRYGIHEAKAKSVGSVSGQLAHRLCCQ